MQGFRVRLAPQGSPPVLYNSVGIAFDVQTLNDGLEGFFLLGGSVEQSCRNLARRSERGDAVAVGSPVVNNFSLGLRAGSAYLELPFTDFVDTTLMVVTRTLDTMADMAHTPVYLGTSDGSVAGGSVYAGNTTQDRVRMYTDAGGFSTDNTAQVGMANWRMLMARYGAAGRKLANLTDADEATATQTGVRVPGLSNLKIGGGQGTSFGGTCEVAIAAVWSRQISDAEKAAVYAQFDPFEAARSIVI